jgi:hypothetical protein
MQKPKNGGPIIIGWMVSVAVVWAAVMLIITAVLP